MKLFWWVVVGLSLICGSACTQDKSQPSDQSPASHDVSHTDHGHEHAAEDEAAHGHSHADDPHSLAAVDASTHGHPPEGDGGHEHGPPGEADHAHAAAADGNLGHAHAAGESWSITSWGGRFEVFAKVDPLVVGQTAIAHTHVTILHNFSPLTEGTVSVILRRAGLQEQVFTKKTPLRNGMYDIGITPTAEGHFLLSFRIESTGLSEEIVSGQVMVGATPGTGGGASDHGDAHDEAISFLKEQQWKTPFATTRAELRTLRDVVRGTGIVKPAAGGEMLLSASIDGVVLNEPWPYLGLSLSPGQPVFSLSSRPSPGRTLGELEALDTESRGELDLARERLARLEELLPVEAVSAAEVASAQARLRTVEAQHEAAKRELESVLGPQSGRATAAQRVRVSAPFAGEIAEVLVSPGQSVSAGQALGRIVRVGPVWVEIHLAPEDAARVATGVVGLWLRAVGAADPTLFESVKLVSLSPQVNVRTGRVECLLELSQDTRRVRLGSAVEAEVLVAGSRRGVVVPATAIVDDAGTPIVYVQHEGESFSRNVVEVLGREGGFLLIEGVSSGQRIVSKGGAAIRRATLVDTGVGHGHVH